MRDHPVPLNRRFSGRLAAAAAAALLASSTAAPAPGGQTASATSGDSVIERLVRVLSLEDARSFGDGWLADRIHDPDPEVRRRAALALGRIGRPAAVAPLVAALAGDEAGAVRSTAAFALGIVEDPLPDEAVLALEAALADPSGRVREKAIEALGRRGGARAGEIVRTRLAELVEEPGYGDRREDVEAFQRRTAWDEARLGLFALARIHDDGGDPGDAAAVLLGPDGSPRTPWWAAAWTAAQLADQPADPALGPLHRAYAGSPDPVIRALGVRGLGRAGAAGADSSLAAAVAPELGHPSAAVRIEAIRAVRALAEADPSVADLSLGARLLAGLDDNDPALRRASLRALAVVPAPEPAAGAPNPLIALLQSPDPELRAGALPALFRQDEDGFWLLLSGWSDPAPLGRAAMAWRLAAIPDPRIRDVLLQTLLPDDDPRVRAAALAGLGTLEAALAQARNGNDEPAAETVEALVRHLEAGDSAERAAAAAALGRLETGAASLRRAYEQDAAAPGFRLAALRAGLARGPERDRIAFARAALMDSAWPVRREAHAFLRRVDAVPEESAPEEPAPEEPAPEEPAPEEPIPAANLAPADYRAMLEAPFSPTAWIETARGEIEIELFISEAPRTVFHFMRLAREGAYDGRRFARVIPGVVAEVGEPPGDDSEAPVPAIRCEVSENLFMRGSVGMALDDGGGSETGPHAGKDSGKDTGRTAFFITLFPQPDRNGRFTHFGHVRRGFGVLDQIEPGDRIRRIRIWDGVTSPHEEG